MFVFAAIALTHFEGLSTDPIRGRWDLVIAHGGKKFAGWLEVRASGYTTLVGRVMIDYGSARPISEVVSDKNGFHFSVPKQWESKDDPVRFDGRLVRGHIEGVLHGSVWEGDAVIGHRAPAMDIVGPVVWGPPISLIGKSLTQHWMKTPGWVLEHGNLVNKHPVQDINSRELFRDFKVHAEYRYPKDSNSGIYLRGRYEVQIEDDYGHEGDSEGSGGIYGVLTPYVNAAKKPGEWQSADITLVGRTVWVTLNGVKVIEHQKIPGPTGGALDSNEAAPGPLKLQGDHGPIEFRKVVVWRRKL